MEKNRDRLIDRWKFLEPFKPHWGLNSGAGSMRDVYVMAPVGRPHLGVPNGTGMDFRRHREAHSLLWGCQAIYLIGGIPAPLKNMKVSWDDYSQYMGK